MSETESNPPAQITLENLLRLKRHERPAPEFWARFDRELKTRALRAFVQAEPWHWRWARILVARVTPWVTAGATAALAVGFAWHGHFREAPAPTVVEEPVVASTDLPVMTTSGSSLRHVAQSALVQAAEDRPVDLGRPTYVVAALMDVPRRTNSGAVPASVAFSAERTSGQQPMGVVLVSQNLPDVTRGMEY